MTSIHDHKKLDFWRVLTLGFALVLIFGLAVSAQVIQEADFTGDGTADLLFDNGTIWFQINRDSADGGFVHQGGIGGAANLLGSCLRTGGMVDQVEYWATFDQTVQIVSNSADCGVALVTVVDTANGKEITRDFTISLQNGEPYAWIDYTFYNSGGDSFLLDEVPSHIHSGARLVQLDPAELVDIEAYINGIGDIGLTSLTWWNSYSPSPTDPYIVCYRPSNGESVTFGFKSWDVDVHQSVAYYTGAAPDTLGKVDLLASPFTMEVDESVQFEAILSFHDGGPTTADIIYSNAVEPNCGGEEDWCDDFEVYSAGSTASPAWTGSGNSGSITVDDQVAYTGSQSLRMFGVLGGCWGALAYRPLDTYFPMTIEVAVKNGTETVNGCHPYRASVQLNTGPSWTTDAISLWTVLPNGDIRADLHDEAEAPVYTGVGLDVWMQVDVELTLPGDGDLHARYFVDGDLVGEHSRPVSTWSFIEDIAFLGVTAQEGTAWFDDVCVSSGVSPQAELAFPSIAIQECDPGCISQPVVVTCVDTIKTLSIPVDVPADVSICNVSFDGCPTENWLNYSEDHSGDSGFVHLALSDGTEDALPPGEHTVAYIVFSINDPVCGIPQPVQWDTTLSTDQYRYLSFVDQTFGLVAPDFDPDNDTTVVTADLPGDNDYDCSVDIVDLTGMIADMFQGGTVANPAAIDVTGDCAYNIVDLTYLIAYLFEFGDAPLCPCSGSPLPKAATAAELFVEHHNGTTRLILDSPADLAGFELTLAGNNDASPISLVDDNIELLHGIVDGNLHLGLVDLQGATMIQQGRDVIIELEGEYTVIDALGSSTDHTPVMISMASTSPELPTSYALHQNYPNPFNPTTTISFDMADAGQYRLTVFNITGQQVASFEGEASVGQNEIVWDASQQSSGVYFYKLETDTFSDSRKMLLLK